MLGPYTFSTDAYVQCESKSSPPPLKLFADIFGQANYISMTCCQYIASLYPHIFTNFGQFSVIFNKTALIFLGVLIVFNVSSFEFHQLIGVATRTVFWKWRMQVARAIPCRETSRGGGDVRIRFADLYTTGH